MLSRFFLLASLLVSPALAEVSPDWVLVFEDNFKATKLNTKKWSLIPYEEGVSHIAWRRYQTVHFCNAGGGAASRTSHRDFAALRLADQAAWHTYGMEWTPEGITFTIDGIITATQTAEQTNRTFGADSKPFHLIIDRQIGGGWVEGSGAKGIDRATLSHRGAVLEIDSVRVWSTPDFRHATLSAMRSKTAPAPKAARPLQPNKAKPKRKKSDS